MNKKEELKLILKNHRVWLDSNGKEGVIADLRYDNLREADLRYANLREADLRYVNLSYANLRYANLSGADLRYAYLRYAYLSGANLSGANLSGAYLREADLDPSIQVFYAFGYSVIIFNCDEMVIGCKQHKIKDWLSFSKKELIEMNKNKPIDDIYNLIKKKLEILEGIVNN